MASPFLLRPASLSSKPAAPRKILSRSPRPLRRLPTSLGRGRAKGCRPRPGVPQSKGPAAGGGGEEEDSGGGGSGGSWGSRSFLLSWYLDVIDRYPVRTNSIVCGLINFTGDLICQLLIDQVSLSLLDIERISVVTLLGFVLVGPTIHFWFSYLNNSVSIPGSPGTIARVFLDQFLFTPVFIGVYMSALVTLEGKQSLVVPTLQQEWFSAVTANWYLWIPFQLINFQFIPAKLQVLAANLVALAWNIILSFITHREVMM